MNISAEKELELINKYTRSPLTQEDVYIFSVTLCDNEVDRDFECFSTKSLDVLGEMFVGKTGISDHSMSSKDQRARVFRTFIEKDTKKRTSYGEIYTALKARAYMLRTKENESLIKEIEGGIKKEVSVGCAVKECICSVCGKDMKKHLCEHIKGRTYNNEVCYGVLETPTDAYEWSFVAVPAQKSAGVTKAFTERKENTETMTIETFKSINGEAHLSLKQVQKLKAQIERLEKEASEGAGYREYLITDIRKYALLIMPSVDVQAFVKGCGKMDIQEMKSLRDTMKSQASSLFPVNTQLRKAVAENSRDNSQFKI